MSKPICPECGQPMPTGSPIGKCPTCLLCLGLPATAFPKIEIIRSAGAAGDQIGHYRLVEQIGEGAFGTVWKAEQEKPVRRRVALKILKLGMDTREIVARFEAERQALAMMDHPNIARVFDGGAMETGRPYFVMELVSGVPFTEFCDAKRLATSKRLELFIQVCEGVQHAHQKGIIHRDLKPTNILVAEGDNGAVPKIIDFGVAKAIEDPLLEKTLLTRAHQFLGTPAYMSPEQAGFGGVDIDTRTDIYALGTVLYELLTGQTPLDSKRLGREGLEAMFKAIREQEPPKPSTRLRTLGFDERTAISELRRERPHVFERRLCGDLDCIVLKAIEKDRTRRYDSANALAADLRRHLQDEPISARPPSNIYRLQKTVRRNKLVFAAVAAVLAVLLVGTITTYQQKIRAEQNLSQARLNAYASEMKLVEQALAENNLDRAIELLERQRPQNGEEDLRGFEWRYFWQLCRPNDLNTFRSGQDNKSVAFSPDGTLLATGTGDLVVVREVSSGRVVTNLSADAWTLSFSPSERILAAGEWGQVRFWDTENWVELCLPLTGVGFPARFSPDGQWLITGEPNGKEPKHQLWRTDTWELVASCPATPELPGQLRNATAFSLDGKFVVTPWLHTTNEVCGLKLWKIPSLEHVEDIFFNEMTAWSATFHPNGRHLLIGTFYGELVVWDLQRREIAQTTQENRSGINTISVAPGAGVFVTASHEQRISLWDSETFKVLSRFRGHSGGSWASSLSPDGRFAATGSFDGTTRLWDATIRDSANSVEHGSLIAGFSKDSRTSVLAPREGDYRWRLVGPTNRTVEVPADPPLRWDYIHRPYDVFADSLMGVLGRTDGSLELWDLTTSKLSSSWQADANALTATSFSPDGKRLATGSSKGDVRVWNISTRDVEASFTLGKAPGAGGAVSKLVFSPDGKLLAGGGWPWSSPDLLLWDLTTKQKILSLQSPSWNVTSIAFSPNGRFLAWVCMGGTEVQIWDLVLNRAYDPLKGHVTGLVEVAFSPDSRTLASGGYDSVKLWNVATRREIANLPYRGTFRSLCFSPDGRTLAASYLTFPGHRVHFYSAPSFPEIAQAEANETSHLQQ